MEAEDKFKQGDWIRENRQGAKPEQVMSVFHPMVHTYGGKSYHWTKIIRISQEH